MSLDIPRMQKYLEEKLHFSISAQELQIEFNNFTKESFDPKLMTSLKVAQTMGQLNQSLGDFAETTFAQFKNSPLFRIHPVIANLSKEKLISDIQQAVSSRFQPVLEMEMQAIAKLWSYSTLEDRIACMNIVSQVFTEHNCELLPKEVLNLLSPQLEAIVNKIMSRISLDISRMLSIQFMMTPKMQNQAMEEGISAVVTPIFDAVAQGY